MQLYDIFRLVYEKNGDSHLCFYIPHFRTWIHTILFAILVKVYKILTFNEKICTHEKRSVLQTMSVVSRAIIYMHKKFKIFKIATQINRI